MSYDYAGELLTRSPASRTTPPPQQQAQSAPVDYASELLAPRNQPSFSQDLGRVVEKEFGGSAPFGSLVKAGMVDDPQTKIRIYANSIFPGEKDAQERFGMMNGEVVYVGKDDKLYKAEPSGVLGGTKQFAANMIGNAPSIIGGTVGAVAGAPAGPGASIGLGALGAAGGKGLQQVISNVALGEPQTVGGNVVGMAKEAAFTAGGAAGGAIFQKWLQRNTARDIDKLNRDGWFGGSVAELDAKAAAQGVDLNAAQRTNLPSLKGRVEALSRMPSSGDDMNAALERTRQQAGAAAENYVSNVSPLTRSVREAGESGRAGATEILERIASDRSTAARPYYQKALEVKVDPRSLGLGDMKAVAQSDAFTRAYERAARLASNDGLDLKDEKNYMRVLHYVKLGLDEMLDPKVMAKEGIGATEQRGIVSIKNKLLQFMDSASPDYARARSIYGHYMPTLKARREGTLGALADLADEDLNTASKIVFNPKNSPEDIRQLRSQFFKHDQGEKWKALTKGYLQDTLEASSKEFKSGPGAGKAVTWRYALLGDPKQAQNLRAAMTDDQWRGFNQMMDVFEAVGRTKGTGNSITMPMQEAAKALRSESGSGLVGTALQPRQKLIEWIEEARLGKYAAKQVEILNDPKALDRLKELRKLSPNDQRFIQGMSSLLGISASPEGAGSTTNTARQPVVTR